LETRNLKGSKARVFRKILPMSISSIYTLGVDVIAMITSGLNRGVVTPLLIQIEPSHIPMGAGSLSGSYLSTTHAEEIHDLTAGHTE